MHVRRLSLVLALAALALPGLASAQARRTTGSAGMQLGTLIGFEDGNGDTGLALRLDGEFPYQALSPQVRMSFVGSLGYSHWTYNAG
ncbi:MAG TPA: porin family protein, partial [Anaeromyxobacter sp.]